MNKKIIGTILIIALLITSIAFAGTILGDEPVKEFTIESYYSMNDGTYCFKIQGLENANPCLTKNEIILDKGNLSLTTITTLKNRLENIRQAELINIARQEISVKTCTINADCTSSKAITGDTWYCVEQQCTTKAPTKEIEGALNKIIGVKQ